MGRVQPRFFSSMPCFHLLLSSNPFIKSLSSLARSQADLSHSEKLRQDIIGLRIKDSQFIRCEKEYNNYYFLFIIIKKIYPTSPHLPPPKMHANRSITYTDASVLPTLLFQLLNGSYLLHIREKNSSLFYKSHLAQ
jgi:hypothetical protein